ncbi:MAG: S53 family peptidase [Mycobacteriales bacterium]
MSRRVVSGVAFAAALATPLALAGTAGASPANSGVEHRSARVCGTPAAGYAACQAFVRVNAKGQPAATAGPAGYGPADLQSAYALTTAASSAGAGQTIAIVDAYNDPNAESDLGVYRSTYGLSACTTANGCFKKVNQNGVQGSYPKNDAGWSQEISLDLDMASAICPNCKILLVEASTPSFANLGTAVNTAAALGAQAISNSYGGSDASDANYGKYYNHPGSAITVSSGDNGYGVEYPASSQYVTAVGGTHLTRSNTTRGWSESVWSGAGSGCSAYNVKPSWQTDSGCAKRTVADVSAVADPNTGVAVYDSFAYRGTSGWLVFGGTSVSAPIIAGVYALAGNGASVNYGSYPYSHTASLNDVTSGSNGTCGTAYLCTGVTGYDGPTGLGTPNGTGGF